MGKKSPPRLLPDRAGNYYAHYWDGRSQRKSLRTNDLFIATARFEGWLKAFNNDKLVDDDPTVEQALSLWFDQWITGRMISAKRYPSLIKNLNRLFGNMRISEITREDSRNYFNVRSAGVIGRNKAATGTIRRELEALRACFNFMCTKVEPRERRIDAKTLPYIELPPESLPRERVLSEDELQLLINACEQHCQADSNRMSRISRFIFLAMETAQRKTSILELTWSRVNFDRGMITFLPEGRAQTRKRRVPLPMSTRLRSVLERAYDERINDIVLDTSRSIDYQLKLMASQLGIDDLSAHVFRHTWATRKAMAGLSLHKIAMFLGDTEKTVRQNYVHLTPDYLSDAVD